MQAGVYPQNRELKGDVEALRARLDGICELMEAMQEMIDE